MLFCQSYTAKFTFISTNLHPNMEHFNPTQTKKYILKEFEGLNLYFEKSS